MLLSAFPSPPLAVDDVQFARDRLLSARAALAAACQELDSQIRVLDGLSRPTYRSVTDSPATTLFERQPVNIQAVAPVAPSSSLVLKAETPAALDPALEQATLEELNSALARAFSQMAARAER